jgi:hypothetical protein
MPISNFRITVVVLIAISITFSEEENHYHNLCGINFSMAYQAVGKVDSRAYIMQLRGHQTNQVHYAAFLVKMTQASLVKK